MAEHAKLPDQGPSPGATRPRHLLRPGVDFVGVGVGALVFNPRGRVLLALRGPGARNEIGRWEFPGGVVHMGETVVDALHREMLEEHGLVIELAELLCVADHFIPDEGEHWVAPAYIARTEAETVQVREPDKCSSVGWFEIGRLPEPLTVVTSICHDEYRARFGERPPA